VTLLVIVVVILGANAKVLMLPSTDDDHAPADVIVVLGRRPDLTPIGASLARMGRAPILLLPTGKSGPRAIPGNLGKAKVERYSPNPYSTQGEARVFTRLARRRGWRRVIVVAARAQATRARLVFDRCFRGDVQVVAAPLLPASSLPRELSYETGALVRALTWARTC